MVAAICPTNDSNKDFFAANYLSIARAVLKGSASTRNSYCLWPYGLIPLSALYAVTRAFNCRLLFITSSSYLNAS
jgi:hypothetical protein